MPKLVAGSKIGTIKDVAGHTEATSLPMKLMFGQPNNLNKLDFKLESIDALTDSFYSIIRERTQTLDMVARETLSDIKAFFKFDSKLVYEITDVPYTTLAPVLLPNIIGLKSNIYVYAQKLDVCLDLATDILEYELASLTKLVAQLLANTSAISSLRPITAMTEMKMHTVDVEKEKTELAAMVGIESKSEYITFGSIYYNITEWKDCGRLAMNINQRLGKLKLNKFAKEIKNTTALMDKLLMRIDDSAIPRKNIEEYSFVIEQASNNIGFAGAVIHMAQTLVTTLNNHNDILRVELDDYRKHRKGK